ncbi:MAG TPA: hypothetical protein VIH21_08290 [Dehalococcoidia bacterium]
MLRSLANFLTRPPVRIALIAMVALAIGALVTERLVTSGGSVRAQAADHAAMLALATLAFAAASAFLGGSWIVLAQSISQGRSRDRFRLAIAFAYSWLGRYVPGSVPFFAGKVMLGSRFGYSTRALTVSTAVESMLEVIVATIFGATMIVIAQGASSHSGLFVALACLPCVGLVALHPRFLRRLTGLALRASKREPLETGDLPRVRTLALSAALITINQTINGLAMLAVLHAVAGAGWRDAALATGALSLSGVLGIIIVLAPAGLGVRDGALTGLLSTRFAFDAAALASVVLRVLTVIADLALFSVALVCDLATGAYVVRAAIGRSAPVTSARPIGTARVATGERPA